MRKILIGLVAIVAVLAVVVALQPSEFSVSRTATVAAPAGDVFRHVNDLHKWDDWSPWAKVDPNAKVAFEGAPSGKGAVFTWSGNDQVGEGRMTIVESRPAQLVRIDVAFVRPFEGSAISEFAFKPEGDGTAVIWTVSGHHNFLAKAMCLILNGQKTMRAELKKGLEKLKSVAEAAAGNGGAAPSN